MFFYFGFNKNARAPHDDIDDGADGNDDCEDDQRVGQFALWKQACNGEPNDQEIGWCEDGGTNRALIPERFFFEPDLRQNAKEDG